MIYSILFYSMSASFNLFGEKQLNMELLKLLYKIGANMSIFSFKIFAGR